MVEAGAEVVETDTFQASRLKLEEWGLAEHTLEINRARRRDRPQGGRRGALRRRLDRPDRPPARLRRPDARADHLPRAASRSSPSRPRACIEGGADLLIIETAQDILEVKAAIFGAREAFKRDRAQRADPGLGLAAAAGRQDAARHRHRRRAHDARGAQGRRHRAELLDRPRGHARRDPLPRRALARCPVHCIPNAGLPLQGPDGETIFPEEPERAGRRSSASSSSATAWASSAAAAAPRPSTSRAIARALRRPRPRPRARRAARRTSRA